jgi:hypothetical protein
MVKEKSYLYLHYQKQTSKGFKDEVARIPKEELILLARKILAKRELFYEILNLIRGD